MGDHGHFIGYVYQMFTKSHLQIKSNNVKIYTYEDTGLDLPFSKEIGEELEGYIKDALAHIPACFWKNR